MYHAVAAAENAQHLNIVLRGPPLKVISSLHYCITVTEKQKLPTESKKHRWDHLMRVSSSVSTTGDLLVRQVQIIGRNVPISCTTYPSKKYFVPLHGDHK